jgi:AcrR family transcriptional regulator
MPGQRGATQPKAQELSPQDDEAPPSSARRGGRRITKEDVVREATRLFAEKGYEGVTMGELAARVGLRKASLFHHFPTKDAIYARVLTELVEGVTRAVLSTATSKGEWDERLDVLSDTITATLGAQPDAARLLVREALDKSAGMAELFGAKIDAVLDAARHLIKAGQRDGVFDRDLDPTHVVMSLIGIHFLPFALDDIMERFSGTKTSHASFVSARTIAVRDQVRRLLLAPKKTKKRAASYLRCSGPS